MATTRSRATTTPPARKAAAARKPAAKKPAAKKTAVAKTAVAKMNTVTLFTTNGEGVIKKTSAIVVPGHTAKLAKERHAKGTSSRAPAGHKTLVNNNGVVHHVPLRHITAAKAKTPRAKALAKREHLGGPHTGCPPTKAGTPQEKRVNPKGKMQCYAVKGQHGSGHSKIVGGARGKVFGVVTRKSKWTEQGFTKGAVGSRGNVMSGRAHHTRGGLTASDFVKSAGGSYVSKKASAAAKARFAAAPKHVRDAFSAQQYKPRGGRKTTTELIRAASTTELVDVLWAFGSKGASKATSFPAGTVVRNSTGLRKVAGKRWSAYKA